MDVLQGLWIAVIVGVVLVAIVGVAIVGALALNVAYRQVETGRQTGYATRP